MSKYLTQHGTRRTHQSEPMRPDQVENSAGGFVWAVDHWTRLRRFLILGSEGGSYYASERKLTSENVTAIRDCLAEDGERTVREIKEISHSGRAPKNDPALFALANAIALGDNETKRAAAEALPEVARIGTHLYHFVAYAETMRGWGRTMRWAISNWYKRNPDQLALQAVKYRQRDGWSHRDLLRLAHPSALTSEQAQLFDWIAHGKGTEHKLIEGFEKAQNAASPKVTADLVREYGLPREALLTEHLNEKEVWEALLEMDMPMTAMMRNLATMTRNGVLSSTEHRDIVLEAFANEEKIHRSRLHPMAILIALRTYASGQGLRGKNTWDPLPKITDALDAAFYTAFDNVEPTGKRFLLGLDVSGSMGGYMGMTNYGSSYHVSMYGGVAGAPISPREAATAMALVTLHAEDEVEIMAFSDKFMPVNFSRRQRLDDACKMTYGMPFRGTDCALPMLWAMEKNKEFDAIVVYTDSETWFGGIHPKQALDQYRQRSGIPVRSVVVGMVSNGFTIADPQDTGMMDVVGFDTAAPALISDFTAGRI